MACAGGQQGPRLAERSQRRAALCLVPHRECSGDDLRLRSEPLTEDPLALRITEYL